METNNTKIDLIKGDEFEKALIDAANIKKENVTSVKTRNRMNYSRYYDIVLMSRRDIQNILDKKKKDRTDQENEKVREFKKETSQTYRQICQLIAPEPNLEEGELTKVQKIVQKIAPIVKMMEYIGHFEIENEFKKYGITFDYLKLEDSENIFENEQIENDIREIFETGKSLREETDKNNEAIKTTIFETAVPIDLQFEKSTNPMGIKSSDFCKLVDLKAKLLMAPDDEAKDKVGEKANDLAGECEFTVERNKILQCKLMDLSVPSANEPDDGQS